MDQAIHVCFLTQDSGFGEIIARALGGGFSTRTCTDLFFDRRAEGADDISDEITAWCDVVLLDLRVTRTQALTSNPGSKPWMR